MVDSSDILRRNRSAVRFATSAALLMLASACVPHNMVPTPDTGFNEAPDDNWTSTNNYLNSLSGTWHAPVHVTLPCATCPGSHIALDIYLHDGTALINPIDIIQNHRPGHIVARIRNQNNFAYPEWGLLAGDVAYLWLGKTNKQDAYAIYRIDDGRVTGLRRARHATYCAMAYNPNVPPVHEIPYPGYSCSDPQPVYSYSTGTSSATPRNLLRLVSSNMRSEERTAAVLAYGDLWFSCSGGCCQADSWALY